MDPSYLEALNYADFMALLGETNRPPGGKNTIRLLVQNAFIDRHSNVLEIGCHTGFTSFEIHRLLRCQVTGMDLSYQALTEANTRRARGERVTFLTADARHLPFADACFDVVMCGGATAWIAERDVAIRECMRVTRTWGRIAAVPFFYREEPPADLLIELNQLLGMSLTSWGLEYWTNLFAAHGLEQYFGQTFPVTVKSAAAVDDYVRWLAARRFNPDVEEALYKTALRRLERLFRCFNRNNNYLSYALLVFRIRGDREERTLFD